MNVLITPRRFTGAFKIPASKSHTIRQLLIASLADGESEIKYPLDSLDTRSCLCACKAFGAEIAEQCNGEEIISWKVRGNSGFKKGVKPNTIINVGNSGTTLYLALATAGLQQQPIVFTGDEQIQKRSAAPLLDALSGLGVSSQSNNGCAPITINGTWKGGKVNLPCPTSQYLSAILMSAPLAPIGTVTEIDVPLLNEKPYIEMTLSYLQAHSIRDDTSPDFLHFSIPGGQSWKAFSSSVPGDFSSAAFPAAAAAITGGSVTLLGLDPQDTQGDRFFLEILKKMGCDVQYNDDGENGQSITVSRKRSSRLSGGTFDLNKTPDLLPAAAVTAAFADGDTALINVAHARIKETDRIAVMTQELAKLGICCTELPDGLVIHGKGALSLSKTPVIDGHNDHRIVMAFAVAALGSPVPVEITTAECAAVTYPGFIDRVITRLLG
jgi:3-phosphoshikimate 1-carboxyvinyltransferase